MINMAHLSLGATGTSVLNKHLACDAAGKNYALENASTMARASEKTNICQQVAASALLVGG